MEIDAINVDVSDKASPVPQSTKASGSRGKTKVPKLDLASGMKPAPTSPNSSSHREQMRLSTMRESEFEEDPMNVGHMATTNEHNDSATMQEAERNFRKMLEERAQDGENHRKEPDKEPIDD